MYVTGKTTGRAMSMPGGLAVGAAINGVVTISGVMFVAKLIDSGKLAENSIGYCIMILLLMSSFLGAKIASIRIKRQRLVVCALSGVIYFGILLSGTALFFGGQYEAVGVTGALVMSGALAAALLGGHSGTHRKRRGARRMNC
jgi:putative membrane protein (TIGR04086 family)